MKLPVFIHDMSSESIDEFFGALFLLLSKKLHAFGAVHVAEIISCDLNKFFDVVVSDKRYRLLCQMWCQNTDGTLILTFRDNHTGHSIELSFSEEDAYDKISNKG